MQASSSLPAITYSSSVLFPSSGRAAADARGPEGGVAAGVAAVNAQKQRDGASKARVGGPA